MGTREEAIVLFASPAVALTSPKRCVVAAFTDHQNEKNINRLLLQVQSKSKELDWCGKVTHIGLWRGKTKSDLQMPSHLITLFTQLDSELKQNTSGA